LGRLRRQTADVGHQGFHVLVFDFAFLGRSTAQTKETIKWEDGKEYPLVKLEISSRSHPFFTGQQKLMDTAGRVEKFMRRYNMSDKAKKEEKK
jgi:large subunit ribosomal protein L31